MGSHLPVLGFAEYPLVWGSAYRWGIAWQDGMLIRRMWYPYALAAGGAAVLARLLTWGPFPVDMVGSGNTGGTAGLRGGATRRRQLASLLTGSVAVMIGLSRLAITGFATHGALARTALLLHCFGIGAIVVSGRDRE